MYDSFSALCFRLVELNAGATGTGIVNQQLDCVPRAAMGAMLINMFVIDNERANVVTSPATICPPVESRHIGSWLIMAEE